MEGLSTQAPACVGFRVQTPCPSYPSPTCTQGQDQVSQAWGSPSTGKFLTPMEFSRPRLAGLRGGSHVPSRGRSGEAVSVLTEASWPLASLKCSPSWGGALWASKRCGQLGTSPRALGSAGVRRLGSGSLPSPVTTVAPVLRQVCSHRQGRWPPLPLRTALS